MCEDCPLVITSEVDLARRRVEKRVAIIACMKKRYQKTLQMMPLFELPDPLSLTSKRLWEIACFEARSLLREMSMRPVIG